MDVVHERCAGRDVHKDEVVVCVRVATGRRVQRIRGRFPTTMRGLLALADWLGSTRSWGQMTLEALTLTIPAYLAGQRTPWLFSPSAPTGTGPMPL